MTANASGITQVGIFYFGLHDGQVPKSVFSAEYFTFRQLLRDLRLQKGITQAQLSTALGMAQSFVSKYEMGERRLDFIEVGHICGELGIGLDEFARSYAKALVTSSGGKRAKRKGGAKDE
jgi:transcriptional regulator with XRE-family HTH domain